MAELTVKYRLDPDGLQVMDLVTERDFLAQRLGIPKHLLQALSWGPGSIMVTYWIVRDVLPLAELALCREDVRAELIQHSVEAVYLDSCPSHPGPVSSRGWPLVCTEKYSIVSLLPSMQADQTLQTIHCKRGTVHTQFYVTI